MRSQSLVGPLDTLVAGLRYPGYGQGDHSPRLIVDRHCPRPLIPHALSLPSAAQLATANTALGLEIEERRTAEASLREAELELRAANAELDSFAYAVSHDLRAPLRAMIGFSTALDEDYHETLDKEAQHYLAQIIRGGKHMGDLIQQFSLWVGRRGFALKAWR